MTEFDPTLPPLDRVSVVKCEDCHAELAKLAWKNFGYTSSFDCWISANNAEIAIQDAHEMACPMWSDNPNKENI
jgi:hypothetical protein